MSDPGYLGNSPYPSRVMYMFTVIFRAKVDPLSECSDLWWGGWDFNPRILVPETSISSNWELSISSLRPSCPHRGVVWATAPAGGPNSMVQNALVRLPAQRWDALTIARTKR